MQRRFNYTDRIPILHKDVLINLVKTDNRFGFEATLDLVDYDLPAEAHVFVEAYRQTTMMRFSWGTVGIPQPPPNTLLSEFESVDDILFRVRITSQGDEHGSRGLMLAEAEKIRLREPQDISEPSESLLPIIPTDLKDELWKLDFSDDKPRLLLNCFAGDYKQIALHPVFVSLVFPAAIREILTWIMIAEKWREFDDLDDHRSRWLRFCMGQLGLGEPPVDPADPDDEDNVAAWIDEAVAVFSRKHAIVGKFQTYWMEEMSA